MKIGDVEAEAATTKEVISLLEKAEQFQHGVENMRVKTFKIESESEADDYLKDLFENREYRAINEARPRSHKHVKD